MARNDEACSASFVVAQFAVGLVTGSVGCLVALSSHPIATRAIDNDPSATGVILTLVLALGLMCGVGSGITGFLLKSVEGAAAR
jgi:hypothetical protein